MKQLLFLSAILLAAQLSQGAIWEEQNQWNQAMEDKYSEWVRTQYNEDFFTTGKWAGIWTDCADAVYTARIIFSYENKLPFIIKDPTGGGSRISNRMSRFDNAQSQKSRVIKFIEFVNEVTSTQSLPYDTYPLAINRDNIRPGAIWLRASIASENFIVRLLTGGSNAPSGHTELIKEVRETGTVSLIGSTVPAKVRKLLISSSFVSYPKSTKTGLRSWIPAQNFGQDESVNKGYSLEQFKMGVMQSYNNGENNFNNTSSGQQTTDQWEKDVKERLALRGESRDEMKDRYIQDLCSMAKARIEVVTDAQKLKAKKKACMDSEEYDALSTPSRDKRIKQTIENFLDMESSLSLFRKNNKIIDRNGERFDSCGQLELGFGNVLSLRQFAKNIMAGRVSSNPNDTLEARWGMGPSDTNGCPAYE
ncbi:MAG: hypothetical protein BroJett040_00220 [Oligoflexia bacterium]|nr:MAG: hypothetical protein BroJett040_00220 [Oligoflexia bacterium]